MFKKEVCEYFQYLQNRITIGLEILDGKSSFKEDKWKRMGGGGGITRVIAKGDVIAKGGVNFSAVHGVMPDAIKEVIKVQDSDFFASGLSIVLHSRNPFVPIIHMNIRYFEMTDGTFWFGGGIDLTPHYIDIEDSIFFHQQLKKTCERYHPTFYGKFKLWADDYFFIQHRQETRGIGGIFFDRLSNEPLCKKKNWEFVKSLGDLFLPIYVEIASRNKDKPFNDENIKWQNHRRSRYAEFNLLYDKGTKFGLHSNGRIESILMSLPPEAQWTYDYQPSRQSEEKKTLDLLKKGVNWAD